MKTLKSNKNQMSTRTLNLVVALFALGLFSVNAQNTPEPPATPEPPKTTTGTSYSVSVDNDKDETSNSSVSIKNTNDYYKFRASFHESKNGKLFETLVNSLGRDNLEISGSSYIWTSTQNGDDIFECKLSKGHLRIYLDRNASSAKFYESIKTLGEDLKSQISGKTTKYGRSNVNRELARAKQELKRAKREAKRAMRN